MEDRGEEHERMGWGPQRTWLFGALLDQAESLGAAACANLRGLGHQPRPILLGLAWLLLGPAVGIRGFCRRVPSPLSSLPHKVYTGLLPEPSAPSPPGQRQSLEVCLGRSLPFPHRVRGGLKVSNLPAARTTQGHSWTSRRIVTLIYIALAGSGCPQHSSGRHALSLTVLQVRTQCRVVSPRPVVNEQWIPV